MAHLDEYNLLSDRQNAFRKGHRCETQLTTVINDWAKFNSWTTELGPVFAHLSQQSIDTGEIPKEWSLANICPLFKKSDRSLACNYRPVSLTCVPCKLLEHIVCSNIMAHLDEYNRGGSSQGALHNYK